MDFLPHELRLMYVIALSVVIFACAYRFVRRRGSGDAWQAVLDAYVLSMAVQYASVGLPGVLGLLHWSSIMIVCLLACAAMWWWTPVRPAGFLAEAPFREMNLLDAGVVFTCGAFVLGYTGCALYQLRFPAVMANDAMTYHVPAAVQWLQTGWLGLYDVWFYNPANTYSPLAGSMFIAWLMAPLGNDLLAKFVQGPALAAGFVATLQLCRAIGAPGATAGVVALAAMLARPFFSQAMVAKDDLFVVVFLAAALVGMRRPLLQDQLGPWRVGVAIGLLFATKYTALFSLPLLLMVVDAPWRAGWRWRQWTAALACTALIAGPWYLRNMLLTGNPLYPTDVNIAGVTLFAGMFTMLRSDRLATLGGLWENLTVGYYAVPRLAGQAVMAYLLLGVWAGSMVIAARRLVHDPLLRAILVGPVLSLALYALKSPYGEMRFIYPALLMLFVAIAWLLRPLERWGALVALPAAMLSTATAVAAQYHFEWFTTTAVITAAVVAAMWGGFVMLYRVAPMHAARTAALAGGLLVLTLVGIIYVEWNAYVKQCRNLAVASWAGGYGQEADAWQYIWDHLPPQAVIAYANTYFTYPLYGFEHRRPVFYAPTRPGVRHLHHLPRLSMPTTGEDIPSRITALTMSDADRQTWLANLEAGGADYLLVSRKDVAAPQRRITPPELAFAANDPQRFEPIFANDFALLYAIRRDYNR